MNFKFYLEKLHNSSSFHEFMEKNKEAFPCSCFFVIDEKTGDNKQHFDYYVASENKMFSFQLEDNAKLVPIEVFNENVPEEITLDYDFDFKNVEKIIADEMISKQVKNQIQKMLFSLQKLNGKDFLVGTIFLSNLGILKINLDISEMKIVLFEKKSLFDFVNVMKKKQAE
ncbi:hypothetical protein KAJ87_03775 [Candidatus Pacearchaeota archaeon]|nr:hypothetical protein [Candidatus Pacearchaeota archaeon]